MLETRGRFGLWIDRARKGADSHLIVIARIDEDGTWIAYQHVPILRRNIPAGVLKEIEIRLTHRYDLELDPHLHAMERLGLRARILHLKIVFANQIADVFQHSVDRTIRSGDGAVDTLMGKEQRALDAVCATYGRQATTNFHAIVDGIELVERDNADR